MDQEAVLDQEELWIQKKPWIYTLFNCFSFENGIKFNFNLVLSPTVLKSLISQVNAVLGDDEDGDSLKCQFCHEEFISKMWL